MLKYKLDVSEFTMRKTVQVIYKLTIHSIVDFVCLKISNSLFVIKKTSRNQTIKYTHKIY